MAKILANEAIRTMTKTAAGMTMGSDAFLLCCVVVMQQDSIQYRRPVSNWNHTLCDILGFNQKQLFRARDRAIEAGWLQYTPGRKSVAGNYMVTIPDHARDCDGTICEEISDEHGNNNGTMCPQSGNNVSTIREQYGNNAGTIRETFPPNPKPVPRPIPGENARDPDNAAEAEGMDEMLAAMKTPPEPATEPVVEIRRNKIPDNDSAEDWVECPWEERTLHPYWFLLSRKTNLITRRDNWETFCGMMATYPLKRINRAIELLRDDGKGQKMFVDTIYAKCKELTNA
jgi:hypothetical protein